MARLDFDEVPKWTILELHQKLLTAFEKAVADLLILHGDITALDENSIDSMQRLGRLKYAQEALWTFKKVIRDLA